MPEKRKNISSGSNFEKSIGYSRAVVAGNWVFVSGTTGFDYKDMTISDSIEQQTEQCFINIQLALEQAGSKLEEIVRVQYIIPKQDEFEKTWPILRKYFENIRPAATMISANLADSRMKIEIEVTAIKNS